MWPPAGAQVSEVSKALAVLISGQFRTPPLSGFCLKGEEDILDFTSREKDSVSTCSHQLSLNYPPLPLPFFFFVIFASLYVKKNKAHLSHSYIRQERRRWYPDVKVWRNLGSEKCARACEDALSAICVMLLMWPLTVQPCDSLSKEFQTGPQAGVVFLYLK